MELLRKGQESLTKVAKFGKNPRTMYVLPLMTGHLFWKATVLGGLYRGVLLYRQVSNIKRTLVGNKIVDHSDVVGASPVGAAPTTSSFST